MAVPEGSVAAVPDSGGDVPLRAERRSGAVQRDHSPPTIIYLLPHFKTLGFFFFLFLFFHQSQIKRRQSPTGLLYETPSCFSFLAKTKGEQGV